MRKHPPCKRLVWFNSHQTCQAKRRPTTLEKVLERLATTEKTTLVCEKAPEGKIRVTSGSWVGGKVILKGQVLEVRNIEGAARRSQNSPPDDWDPPI
jgi:hypothetical protein